jgi:methylated-DNA-[protein]-cysteine S-methyltransferase
MQTTLYHSEMSSPIGPLTLLASTNGLVAVFFHPPPDSERAGWVRADDLLADTRAQLTEYFSGRRQTFTLSLDLHGTAFQLRVWRALREIPYGETISYAELARRIGNPAAARAVGLANGRNPVSIIVPCHRVIGSSGAMVGYGGGLERKRFLLQLEGARVTSDAKLTRHAVRKCVA